MTSNDEKVDLLSDEIVKLANSNRADDFSCVVDDTLAKLNQLNYSQHFLTEKKANRIICSLMKIIPLSNDQLITKFCCLVINFLNKQTLVLESHQNEVVEYFLKILKKFRSFDGQTNGNIVLCLRALSSVLYKNVQNLFDMHVPIVETMVSLSSVSAKSTNIIDGSDIGGGQCIEYNDLSLTCAIVQNFESLTIGEEYSQCYLSDENRKIIVQHLLQVLQNLKLRSAPGVHFNLYSKTVISCFKGLKNILLVSHTFPNDFVNFLVSVIQAYMLFDQPDKSSLLLTITSTLPTVSTTNTTTSTTATTTATVVTSTNQLSKIQQQLSKHNQIVEQQQQQQHLQPSYAIATSKTMMTSPRTTGTTTSTMTLRAHLPSNPINTNCSSSCNNNNNNNLANNSTKNKRNKRKKIKSKQFQQQPQQQHETSHCDDHPDSDVEQQHQKRPTFHKSNSSKSDPIKSIVSADDAFWSTFGVSDSSDYSDTEVNSSQSNIPGKSHLVEKMRTHTLTCFHLAVKYIDKKTMFGLWSQLVPESFVGHNVKLTDFPLFALIVKDQSFKIRLAGLSILTSLIDGSKQFLMAAEDGDRYQNVAYTPFSVRLAGMIKELHRCLLHILSKEQVFIVIVQAIKCLGVLVSNSPYHRLKPGLLSRTTKVVRPFLYHKDANIRVVSLTCMGSVVSVRTPLAEVVHILESKNKFTSSNNSLSSFSDLRIDKLELTDATAAAAAAAAADRSFSNSSSLSASPVKFSSSLNRHQLSGDLPVTSACRSLHFSDLQPAENSASMLESDNSMGGGSNYISNDMSWLMKVCIEIITDKRKPSNRHNFGDAGGCSSSDNSSSGAEDSSSSSDVDYISPSVSPSPASKSLSTPAAAKQLKHVIPVRVEALQLLTLITKGYFSIVKKHLSCVREAILFCLQDSDQSVLLHACKLLLSLSTAVNATTAAATTAAATTAAAGNVLEQYQQLWWTLLDGPVQQLLATNVEKSNVDEMVVMTMCECIGSIGQKVFSGLPASKHVFCITMMLGLTSDPNAYVRIGALSAIGRCLEYPCLREDECFLVDATSCLIKSCRDSNLSVVMKATWSISNLTDALLPNKDENSYPSSLLLELYTTSCDLCTKNDKTRSNALRALGNLLNFTPKQFIESEKFREVMDLSLKLINNYMTSGSVKVRWNACYAYGKLMKNEFAYNQVHPNIKKSSFKSLLHAIKTCKNFKVKISATTVLGSLTNRNAFLIGQGRSNVGQVKGNSSSGGDKKDGEGEEGEEDFFIPILETMTTTLLSFNSSKYDYLEIKIATSFLKKVTSTILKLFTLTESSDLEKLHAIINDQCDDLKVQIFKVISEEESREATAGGLLDHPATDAEEKDARDEEDEEKSLVTLLRGVQERLTVLRNEEMPCWQNLWRLFDYAPTATAAATTTSAANGGDSYDKRNIEKTLGEFNEIHD